MTFRCHYCGWVGEGDERVPATDDWITQHDVDRLHFKKNGLNCPEFGEAQWILEGDDDNFVDFEDE